MNNEEDSSTLWSYLSAEVTRSYILKNDEETYSTRREKVYSFIRIPKELEKSMTYGLMQCTDSLLFVYTFLFLRFFIAIWTLITESILKCFSMQRRNHILMPAQICDILKTSLVIICAAMLFYIDTNIMYHLIKSQSVIKLYLFYNMLEVADKLFYVFGQDTIDALLWTATTKRNKGEKCCGVLLHFLLAIVYVFLHSMLILLQATTLNVAINASNKALLTILISNNFVELKDSIFKKIDKASFFQVLCCDLRERFHLIVLLFIVILQTMKEYSWNIERLWILIPECLLILTSEIFVDWIKHAFISRFNELTLNVYQDYAISFAYDTAQTRQTDASSDHSDVVARRMGLISLPLAVVLIRIVIQSIQVTDFATVIIIMLMYLYLISFRILNSIILLGIACNLITQHNKKIGSVYKDDNPTQD